MIAGNVLWLLRQKLGWEAPKQPKVGGSENRYRAVRHDVRIWVHAHHPAHRGRHEVYFKHVNAAFESHKTAVTT